MSFLTFISRLLGMSEKTPYQVMREKQKTIIEKQQLAAENRSQAFIENIEFKSQADLNEKLLARNRETLRLAKIRREEEEQRAAENRRRRDAQTDRQCAQRIAAYDEPRKSSTSSSSSSSSSSSYSSHSSCSSSDSSSSSCDSSSSSSSCD